MPLAKALLMCAAGCLISEAAVAGAASPATRSASDTLSEVFIRGCLEGRVAADKLTQVEADDVPKAVLKDSKRASDIRVFAVSKVTDSYLIVANFAGQEDGLVQRCGVFSPHWDMQGAKAAVFDNPLLGPNRVLHGGSEESRNGRLIYGVRYSPDYDSEVAYGSGRLTYMMMSAYDPAAAERRRAAMQQFTDCLSKPPAPGSACKRGWQERARATLRSYNEL